MAEQVATNITFHEGTVSAEERLANMGQKGATLWFTGLSGSGKSTIAVAVEQVLLNRGNHAYRLDGDNIRMGLNKNLGFSPEDRTENIRRIGEVSKLFADAGVISIASFISPYAEDRDAVRALHAETNVPYFECYIDCSLEAAEERDPKGLYKKARAGEIKGFTGIDAPYEEPTNAELHLKTHEDDLQTCVTKVIEFIDAQNLNA
ncbi:MAG: adenylyl-sulfate kinase [Phycisphaerae bacterium]|jgi:adenylylsulfate kinase|nr:adenylyl-sulfate kinase [Phycisphaerae bacterium]MBT6164693.1 adenylyl-sulfate kinase [Phycisphaerae bacterium]MBT7656902.1 adenylyl-sulfate kinase [Phycisphaerae bacterium]